jgi:cytochrome c oxidase assembly protein Cox11
MFLSRWINKLSEKKATNTAARKASRPTFRPGLEALGDRITPYAGGGFFFDSPPPFAAPWSLLGADLSSTTQTATQLAVISRSQAYAGQATRVTVVALDANGMVVPDYTGTVHFSSTDGKATLPADYTFTSSDHGRHTFTITPSATGSMTVTATDTATASITGSATINVNTAPVVTHFFVETEEQGYVGSPTEVLVAALDASNHLVRGYTGTVALTSTGAGDTLPANYTFTSSDRGIHLFSVTPGSTGSDTFTATDTGTSSITGTATLNVNAAQVVTHLAVVAPPWAVSGQPTTAYVVALDANNRIVSGYTGTVHFTSSDSKATLPADVTFSASDHGIKAVSVTFGTTGSETLTATDTATATATITGDVTIQVGQPISFPGFGFGGGFFGGFRARGRF